MTDSSTKTDKIQWHSIYFRVLLAKILEASYVALFHVNKLIQHSSPKAIFRKCNRDFLRESSSRNHKEGESCWEGGIKTKSMVMCGRRLTNKAEGRLAAVAKALQHGIAYECDQHGIGCRWLIGPRSCITFSLNQLWTGQEMRQCDSRSEWNIGFGLTLS